MEINMLRPTTLGLALMQAALKVNQPGTIAHQIVWRGENTTAGVIEEPNGLKRKQTPRQSDQLVSECKKTQPKPRAAGTEDNGVTAYMWLSGEKLQQQMDTEYERLAQACQVLPRHERVRGVWNCQKHGRISLLDEEPPFDTEYKPTVAEINGEAEPDFYEVQANQYGHQQVFQRNVYNYASAAGSPVCTCRHASVRPNRG